MADSFASEGTCNFVVEGYCCSSSAPVVAPCIHCLVAPIGHIPGRLEAAIVVCTAGIDPVGLVGTALVDTGSELGIHVGIGYSSTPSVLVEPRPVP